MRVDESNRVNRVNRLSRSSFNLNNSQRRGAQQKSSQQNNRQEGRKFEDVLNETKNRNKDRKVDKDGYVIPPQRSTGEKLKDSVSGVTRDQHNRRVNSDGYVIPPQRSFMEKLRNSIGQANDNAKDLQGGKRGNSMDHEFYRTKMGSNYTRKESNVHQNKVGESIGVDIDHLTRESNVHRSKVGESIDNHNVDLGGDSIGSVSSKPDLNTMTYEARAEYDREILNDMINSGELTDEGRQVLNSLSSEEQANFSAEQYYVQNGEVPTSFEHTFMTGGREPEAGELSFEDREMLDNMSEGEQANYFAKEYYDEYGKIPTSFEHTYEGEAELNPLSEEEQFNHKMRDYYNLHGVDMTAKPNKERDFTEHAPDTLTDDARAEYNAQRHYDRFGDLLTDTKVEEKRESSITNDGMAIGQAQAQPELTGADLDGLQMPESALQL